jgi:sugar lactone lactonase YvrE
MAFFGSVWLHAAEEASTPAPGTIVTVAGSGKAGYSGDGGPATQAQLNAPHGLAVDGQGNLFVVDHFNQRIRKVGADGMITTVAGTGRAGYTGDGGKAIDAQLQLPMFLAFNGAGELFISDWRNRRVRKLSPDGLITTAAGNGKGGYSGDGGPAAEATFAEVVGLAMDAAGNLFIADPDNRRIRRVSPEGVITTVAGNGKRGYSRNGGLATEAQLDRPVGVAVDAAGNLFITEIFVHVVRKVDTKGIITTVAGTGEPGFSGDGGPAVAAQLSNPFGVAVDSAGNLFIADWGNYRVRKVDSTGIITTVAGNGGKRYSGEGGPATATGLRGPLALGIDAAGSLLISQSGFAQEDSLGDNERVLKVVGVAAPGLIAGVPFPKQ